MSDNAPNPRPAPRRKVNQSLQYRWGIVGIVLAVGFFGWYLGTKGVTLSPIQPGQGATSHLEKITCPRCSNDPEKKKGCSLCGGLGSIWVPKEERARQAGPRP